jgi:hypothetical protein
MGDTVRCGRSDGTVGFVATGWSTTDAEEKQAPVTTLVGRRKDQAQLSGILNALYEMHLAILTVQALESEEDSDDTTWREKDSVHDETLEQAERRTVRAITSTAKSRGVEKCA